MNRFRCWALASILAAYIGLGTVYSVTVPVFEAPDESFHFFAIKHILDHRALPVQKAQERGLWEQEGSQPPLYYLISALWVSGIDLSDAEALLWSNPQANIGDPANPGNKNVYIHPSEQDFPWHSTVLAVHILRFFSLGLGTMTVYLTWAIVELIFPSERVLAMVVAATVAFIPQFLFITSTVNNDNLMTCLGTLTIYLLLGRLKATLNTGGAIRSANSVFHIPYRWFLLGIVLGLACLTKLSALALLGLAGLVIALMAWHRRSWKALWQLTSIVGGSVVVVAGWWYVRNVVLYGEPTGLTAMWEVVGRRTDFGQDLWGEFRGLRWSFWGLFGWFSIRLPDWVYRVLDVFSLLSLAGLFVEMGRWFSLGLWRGAWASLRYREPEWGAAYRPLALGILGTWLGVVFVSLVRWTSLTHGSQGRLLFPAVGVVALWGMLGLRAWFFPRVRNKASAVLTLSLLGLAVAAPWVWIAPAYAHPAQVERLPEGAIPQDLTFGDAVILRGVGFEQESARPGDAFRVNLYWEAVRPLSDDGEIVIWLRLLDAGGQGIGLEDSYPGAGTFPTPLWPVSQLLADRQYVRIGEDTEAPLVARLDVELYWAGSGKRLTASHLDLRTIGRVKVVPRRWPKVGVEQAVARLDAGGSGSVILVSVDAPEQVQRGEACPVTLTWLVRSPPENDYAVFVHLEDAAGKIYGYGDGVPRRGNYPTRYWASREVIVDEHSLAVNEDAPSGYYRLKVGLYSSTGRVPAYRSDGTRWADDAVDPDQVQVRRRDE